MVRDTSSTALVEHVLEPLHVLGMFLARLIRLEQGINFFRLFDEEQKRATRLSRFSKVPPGMLNLTSSCSSGGIALFMVGLFI